MLWVPLPATPTPPSHSWKGQGFPHIACIEVGIRGAHKYTSQAFSKKGRPCYVL